METLFPENKFLEEGTPVYFKLDESNVEGVGTLIAPIEYPNGQRGWEIDVYASTHHQMKKVRHGGSVEVYSTEIAKVSAAYARAWKSMWENLANHKGWKIESR